MLAGRHTYRSVRPPMPALPTFNTVTPRSEIAILVLRWPVSQPSACLVRVTELALTMDGWSAELAGRARGYSEQRRAREADGLWRRRYHPIAPYLPVFRLQICLMGHRTISRRDGEFRTQALCDAGS
eukprot:3273286-Rhodomonas_salina.1